MLDLIDFGVSNFVRSSLNSQQIIDGYYSTTGQLMAIL